MTIGGLGLSTLKPEHAREIEVGADMGLWGDRVSLEATYYNKQSRDALISRVLAPSHGIVTSRFENLGQVTNSGFELGLYTQPIRGGSVTWDLNVTASFLNNNLDELGTIDGDPVPPIIFGEQRHVPGFPLGGFWTRPYTYADNNGDGMIDQTEVRMAPLDSVIDSDKVLGRKYMGAVLPTRETSISTSLGLFEDKLRIAARLDYMGGHMQYNNTEGFRCIATGNNCRAIHDPTAPLEQQARAVVRRFIDGSSQFGYIEKSDFAKLREVCGHLHGPDLLGPGGQDEPPVPDRGGTQPADLHGLHGRRSRGERPGSGCELRHLGLPHAAPGAVVHPSSQRQLLTRGQII